MRTTNRTADFSDPRVIDKLARLLDTTPEAVRRTARLCGLLPVVAKVEGTGYYSQWAVVDAAYRGGRTITFDYAANYAVGVPPVAPTITRRVTPTTGVLRSQRGDYYFRGIDLDKDGPRCFRIDRATNVQDAGIA